jgi:hypothetical protein
MQTRLLAEPFSLVTAEDAAKVVTALNAVGIAGVLLRAGISQQERAAVARVLTVFEVTAEAWRAALPRCENTETRGSDGGVPSVEMWTSKRAALELGLTESRIRQLARSGELAGFVGARGWRLDAASVRAYGGRDV